MKTIAVIGAGGNAREVAGLIRDLNEYNLACYQFLGFLADGQGEHDSPLLGSFDWLRSNCVDCLAMGIGSPQAKLSVGRRLMEAFPDIEWPILIHPTAYVGRTCTLGRGAIVCVRAIATENVRIGELAQLNFGCTVGHEAQIGAGCIINPGANVNGGVVIGEGSMIGSGSQILQYLRVGTYAKVGAGAVVLRDVNDGETAVGIVKASSAVAGT